MEDGEWLDRYEDDANRTPPLDEAVERSLAMAVAAGDVQAAARLHQANQRLVLSVARRYEAGAATVPFEALVRAGDFGLEMALERFDVSKQFRFSTYAVWWIRQQITRVIAERGRGTGA